MTQEKRYQLIGLVAGTVTLLLLLWLFVVRAQQVALEAKASSIEGVEKEIEAARKSMQIAQRIQEELQQSQAQLEVIESSMAEGDLYRWVIKKMRDYQDRHEVEITDFDPPQLGEFGEIPKLPYPSATFAVIGTARFHGFGRFLAALENDMPFLRLRGLELTSASGPGDPIGGKDTLSFTMHFDTLVRDASNAPSQPPKEK